RDLSDIRPVVIELKKGKLRREDLAQILEYKALIVSMQDSELTKWKNEFGINYHAPKLMLICSEISDELKLSANLAGVEVKTFKGVEKAVVNFDGIDEIKTKLEEWNDFIKSGNRTLPGRAEWVEQIIDMLHETFDSMSDLHDLETIDEQPSVDDRFFCVAQSHPFINIPIYYNDVHFMGLIEYDEEANIPFSSEYFYCEISFLYQMDEELLDDKSSEVLEIVERNEYSLLESDGYFSVIKIKREILEDKKIFKKHISQLIKTCIEIKELHDE
ncbi:MAG: hypothetical protein HRT72_11780, partial [Flavobacteriales bacterium]|nr:hypothetical protein [Flavobacteriales bacterium]